MTPPVTELSDNRIRNFRRKIFRFYETHGRKELSFRLTTDPYAIAVSEIMLQQTQVERVVPKYEAWVNRWPDWQALANTTTQQLLSAWSGLGYNRRAIYLGKMAKVVVSEHGGRLPQEPSQLEILPGIGPYTSRAILIFAFNKPLATVDTNIRRVLIHELNLPLDISPAELQMVANDVLPKRRSRVWHYALMDYSRGGLPYTETKVKPLTTQSKFEGSIRQIRGEIIRRLTSQRSVRLSSIAKTLKRDMVDVEKAALGLEKDGMIVRTKKSVRLAGG